MGSIELVCTGAPHHEGQSPFGGSSHSCAHVQFMLPSHMVFVLTPTESALGRVTTFAGSPSMGVGWLASHLSDLISVF